MPLVLECDGCSCKLTPDAAKKVGRLVECYYCPTCGAAFDKADAEIDRARVRLSKEFEKERARVLTAVRKKLTRLPDE